jgi:hypothetical protein
MKSTEPYGGQKKMTMPYSIRQVLPVLIIVGILLLAAGPGLAQSSGEAAAGGGKSLEDLGKELNNPISSVWNITTQSNLYLYKGNLSPAYRGQFVFNFQPVLPIPLTDTWTLIPRPVIPILSNPYISGVNIDVPFIDRSSVNPRWDRTGGLGDIALVTLLSPNIPGMILGFGPTFVFPTAGTYDLGQGKWQTGPAVVVGFVGKKWVGGVFPQHWWSVGGTSATDVTSQTNIQYFLYRMLPKGWQVGFAPNIIINWRANHKNQLTFPLGLGVGRTFKLAGVPVQSALEFQWMPVYPEDFGQRYNIRFVFKPVLPSLIKKPIFE